MLIVKFYKKLSHLHGIDLLRNWRIPARRRHVVCDRLIGSVLRSSCSSSKALMERRRLPAMHDFRFILGSFKHKSSGRHKPRAL